MMYNACPMWASTFVVPASNVGEDYLVKFFPIEKPVCTCPAYRYSGEYDDQMCKHIALLKKVGCFWVPIYGTAELNMKNAGANDLVSAHIALFSTTKHNVSEENCPGCDRQMIEVFV